MLTEFWPNTRKQSSMKLSPEVLRFAFLMEEIFQKLPSGAAHDRTAADLFNEMDESVAEVEGIIDFEHQTLPPDTSLRLFAEACARIAVGSLMLTDNVNQLPITRHGLIEAMNAHCT